MSGRGRDGKRERRPLMKARMEVTRDIGRSPTGPKIGAFFDVDRTLVAGFSALAFFRDKLSSGNLSPGDLLQSTRAAARFGLRQTSFPTLIEESSSDLKGLSEEELAEVGERVFLQRLATEIYPESRALVKAHQRRGHTVVIVSSATHFQVDALARELGIEHVLCTELELEEGRFTGKVIRPACYKPAPLPRSAWRKQALRPGARRRWPNRASALRLSRTVPRHRRTRPWRNEIVPAPITGRCLSCTMGTIASNISFASSSLSASLIRSAASRRKRFSSWLGDTESSTLFIRHRPPLI